MNPLPLIKSLPKKRPTSKEMKDFADQYSKIDWLWMCRDPQFLQIFAEDLNAAKEIANKRLSN